ncbi:uncharacterized protein LOC123698929 isoform X1 [Colias croceus]|uniref:uncharacterized protein LOC123698929 isoform X1 n=1 Tax=Colias crocea TaxID=72248 RepID=UPI001E27DCC7|nr:uncharacterized protein LOC123698929 isoform X1 [Colias croceus]XP_045501711.1 uncharacterized protein LOC123698929 isoform X1 [Colias croceus]XP_045501712.1 uncharacterized protein LOC123698929 isoform X1 [Colias croceus]
MTRTNCSVYGCKSSNTSKFQKDLKFHRFPRDERRELWIEACQRPELKSKTDEQLYNMHVCGLHFERWMYMKTKLKSSAIPVANLPSASLHSMSTQTEPIKIDIIGVSNRGVQQRIDIALVGKSVVASTSAQTSQTTSKLTDDTPSCAKCQKDEVKSMDVTYEQFLLGCDKFLSPNLSKIVKAQAKQPD